MIKVLLVCPMVFLLGYTLGQIVQEKKDADKLMKDSLDIRNFKELPKRAKRKEFTQGIDRRKLERRMNKK